MNRTLLALIAISIVFLGCTVNPQDLKTTTQSNSQSASTNTNPGGMQTSNSSNSLMDQNSSVSLTLIEIAKHNTANDYWMAIDGQVLNLSSFIAHPGESAYVPYCDTDATRTFSTKGNGIH